MKRESRLDLFRYGIISPLILEEANKIRASCCELSKKKYYYKGKEYQYSGETIRKWYYKYKKEGFDGLSKNEREDKGCSRKLSEEVIAYIIELKSKYPKMTTKKIYDKLKNENYTKGISIDCFYRYMRVNHLKREQMITQERRRFEQEYPNACWQGDTSNGPYIVVEGKKYRTYLIHFIDDKSRLIVGYGFYFNDNAKNVQEVLKKAIKKYGIPKQIYLDNGKSYKNVQIDIICARLGIKITHTHAYDPSAKGKVERSFRTIKEGWMYARDWNKYHSLESLEKDYGEYLYDEYINKEHRELKDTPNNVWHKGIVNTNQRRIEEEKLEEMFMHKEIRKVSNDRTISFNNILYEVPYKYVSQEIEIRYYVGKQEELWIYEKGVRKEKCKKLNKQDNSKVKRQINIDYSKMLNKEEDVVEKEESERCF